MSSRGTSLEKTNVENIYGTCKATDLHHRMNSLAPGKHTIDSSSQTIHTFSEG